ncbi:hypothetical protein STAS_00533 [Striga asiatica]|uniref:Uncharacterized protein n=1 Tax=Striga asiatica TaxID=4170 RepID=A0A5A7NWX7_STRAF|nr:hypothetical protein STAS_00533 [Striga asiatica]
MNGVHHNKNHDFAEMSPGYLGRMTNVLELNMAVPANKLLNCKPHQGGAHLTRSRSDVTSMRPAVDSIGEKESVSDFNSSFSNRTSNKTPMKMLIAQEMSAEFDSRRHPPNLVAKLMGIDALPQREPGQTTHRSHSRVHPQNTSAGSPMNYSEPHNGYFHYLDPNQYKDVNIKWQQSHKYEENINDRKMNLVRQKFIEAKRLSVDEKLHQSKQFQDAVDVLSSNHDLFLKCLQEPNQMSSQYLHGPPETRRITVLRPSNVPNSNNFPTAKYRDEKQIQKGTFVQPSNLEKTHPGNSTQSTRIVVLKPSPGKLHNAEAVGPLQSHLPNIVLSEEFFGDTEDAECRESRKVAKAITRQMRERLGDHRQGETLVSSVFSFNGYAGDESSFDKSEIECEDGDPSDLEAASSASRRSWDYADRLGSLYSSPVFTRASYSPESSVCREAKKRLSERWAMMASDGSCPEQRQFRRSSSTLGEMLALLETKKEGPQRDDESCFELFVDERRREVNVDCSPRNLTRSKSVPVSSTVFGTRPYPDIPESDKRILESPREDVKETSVVSSFRGKVSSLFFSRNKRTGKNKSAVSGTKDEARLFNEEICSDKTQSLSEKGWDGDLLEPKPTGKQGTISPEARLAMAELITSANIGEKHDQPNLISVLDPPLEENEHTTKPRDQKGVDKLLNCIGPSLIDKSPPIGSIARTLSWDDSCVNTTVSFHPKPKRFTAARKTDEERDCFSLVKTLLSTAGHEGRVHSSSFLARWHSPESPLDPSLKDNYTDDSNDTLHEAKQRQYVSIHQELVFDCVNEALMDISGCELGSSRQKSIKADDRCITDEVWARMKVWFQGEENDCGAHYNLAVERVVGREVSGEGWNRNFNSEMDDLGKEIGGLLLEELVEETVVEFTGRV